MSKIDEDLEVLRLQLRKPKKWNWELSTTNSAPHIPLPIIQLFDHKKNLLAETKPYERKSWTGNFDYKISLPQRTKSCASERIRREPQRTRSVTDMMMRNEIIRKKSLRNESIKEYERSNSSSKYDLKGINENSPNYNPRHFGEDLEERKLKKYQRTDSGKYNENSSNIHYPTGKYDMEDKHRITPYSSEKNTGDSPSGNSDYLERKHRSNSFTSEDSSLINGYKHYPIQFMEDKPKIIPYRSSRTSIGKDSTESDYLEKKHRSNSFGLEDSKEYKNYTGRTEHKPIKTYSSGRYSRETSSPSSDCMARKHKSNLENDLINGFKSSFGRTDTMDKSRMKYSSGSTIERESPSGSDLERHGSKGLEDGYRYKKRLENERPKKYERKNKYLNFENSELRNKRINRRYGINFDEIDELTEKVNDDFDGKRVDDYNKRINDKMKDSDKYERKYNFPQRAESLKDDKKIYKSDSNYERPSSITDDYRGEKGLNKYETSNKLNINDRIRIKECLLKSSSLSSCDYDRKKHNYFLRSSKAGTLLLKEDSTSDEMKRRRRSRNKTVEISSDDEAAVIDVRKKRNKSRSSRSSDRSGDRSSLVCKQTNKAINDTKIKTDCDGKQQSSITMGANFSRHSSKGMSGRRCQSISNICNSKDHYMDPSTREIDAAYKFCNSLPSPNGTACNNNHEHKPVSKKSSLPNREQYNDSGHPHSECHPLQWKFTEVQNLCDQGYGSERSPEEEIPPPLSSHGSKEENISETCESPYPFITAENTFEVELTKGSRGLGLSVCGGVDSDSSWPGLLRIKRLFPHQPAATSGLLQVGDLILEANGVSVSGLSNCEALEVLRMTPNKVILLVCRPPPDVISAMSPVSDVPPPPPKRASTPTHANISMNDGYDTRFEIALMKVQGSLGFTLCKEEVGISGHYIRALVREPAISDGRIQPGDKILEVNGTDISSMTHEEAVQFLRHCDKEVHLTLYREGDRTPTTDLSPTETTPNSSFRPKANLRQEAVDMLTDLAARKLSSDSPCTSPRHGRDVTDGQYDPDDDKAVRPCFLELYNPNQTPLAVRKSKFNLSLAHNAYELNNLDPEMLDAPNLNCAHVEDTEPQHDYDYPEEPVSMPHLSCNKGHFCHKKPAYQSAHVESNNVSKSNSNAFATPVINKGEVTQQRDSLQKWKGVVFSAERDLLENDAQILNIELNRGWNSRLGFSLQEIDGCTCVSAVYPDSVAARDGRLRPGDCLLRVNDEMVENMKTCDVIDLLRIIRGPVCITVLRRRFRLD